MRLELEIVHAMPKLRSLALSLCGDADRADDLVQEALARGLSSLSSFSEGTNLIGWLFTILRNFYYNDFQKRRREVADPEGRLAAALVAAPSQEFHIDFLNLTRALQYLPRDQRQALELVAIGGFSYEEAAVICNCPVGTVRSRVNRARGELTRISPLALCDD